MQSDGLAMPTRTNNQKPHPVPRPLYRADRCRQTWYNVKVEQNSIGLQVHVCEHAQVEGAKTLNSNL